MVNRSKASLRGQSRKHGLPPGTIVYVGEKSGAAAGVHLMRYAADVCREGNLSPAEQADIPREAHSVTWINVDGMHDVASVTRIGQGYGVHTLTLEDIANTNQRPKTELFEFYAFITVKMLRLNTGAAVETDRRFTAEHIGIVLGPDFVLSFQEAPGDVFDTLRDRIRNGKGRIRKLRADYLAYSLLDAIVDGYFTVLENLGDRIAEIDDRLVVTHPERDTLRQIHSLKQELIYIRRCVWPLRELVSALQKIESDLIGDDLAIFLRDLYDHTVQAMDTVETYRELLSGMTDLSLSIAGNRMNEVMKVLTIIATVFIPLTFIAGVYGMNFDYMPELHFRWGYPAILLIMTLATIGMLIFFRRKRWL